MKVCQGWYVFVTHLTCKCLHVYININSIRPAVGRSPRFVGQQFWANSVKNTKEHIKQVREKLVEEFEVGLGHRTTCQVLNFSQFKSSCQNEKSMVKLYTRMKGVTDVSVGDGPGPKACIADILDLQTIYYSILTPVGSLSDIDKHFSTFKTRNIQTHGLCDWRGKEIIRQRWR